MDIARYLYSSHERCGLGSRRTPYLLSYPDRPYDETTRGEERNTMHYALKLMPLTRQSFHSYLYTCM